MSIYVLRHPHGSPSLSLVAGIYSPVEKNRGGVNSTTKSDFSDGCGTYERIALARLRGRCIFIANKYIVPILLLADKIVVFSL